MEPFVFLRDYRDDLYGSYPAVYRDAVEQDKIMILTREFALSVNRRDSQLLKGARETCAQAWNDVLKIAKDYRLANDGKWISKSNLERATKGGKYLLHSQSIQAVVSDYVEARTAAQTKRKEGDKHARYPWKNKKYRAIEFKQMAIRRTEKNTISLPTTSSKLCKVLMPTVDF